MTVITVNCTVGTAPINIAPPTISGISTIGQTSTATPGTWSGSPTPTVTGQWHSDGSPISGATGLSFTATLAEEDTTITYVETAVNAVSPSGVTATSNGVGPLGVVVGQTATFGTATPAGSGGWRPQKADGSVEAATAVSVSSGSPGATPSVSSGRVVWSAILTSAANGTVLSVTGASGATYTVTVAVVSSRKDIATDADINAAQSYSANLGLTLVLRQNAQIARRSGNWINIDSTAKANEGLARPITIKGEGSYFPGEYHLHSWDGYVPSGTTIDGLVMANQRTHASLLMRANSSRRIRNVTIRRCRFEVDYDVDNVGGGSADWSGGFGTTGYNQTRFIYFTGAGSGQPGFSNITVEDNFMSGGYIQAEIACDGFLWYAGNYQELPYFDYRKISRSQAGAPFARYDGGNFLGESIAFSVNESGATEPHPDMDQGAGGGQGIVMHYYEANIAWAITDEPVQSRFQNIRSASLTDGWRWSSAGEMFLISTTHALSTDYPDNCVIDRAVILPRPGGVLPLVDGVNALKWGSVGNVGTHKVRSSSFRNNKSGTVQTAATTFTNFVSQVGWTSTEFAAAVDAWASWGSLPQAPSFAEAYEFFKPKAGGVLEGISPYGEITPGTGLQSDYTISEALRPTPNLSALTVTTPATAAFTVDSDTDQNITVFWSVFSRQITDAHAIRNAMDGLTPAVAYGLNHRGNTPGTVTGGGTASLSAGTYWLCVAQFNGLKKYDVATVQFTV